MECPFPSAKDLFSHQIAKKLDRDVLIQFNLVLIDKGILTPLAEHSYFHKVYDVPELPAAVFHQLPLQMVLGIKICIGKNFCTGIAFCTGIECCTGIEFVLKLSFVLE